jgi:hypothetical protein
VVPSELLSGPDLGGGYLHHLSLDRSEDSTTFTYHAQEGGQDANGPPIGPLAPFGYVHPEAPCQFGGPRCWHRRFLLPFSEVPRVRSAYNRSRFVLEAMLDQVYRGASVGFESALAEIARRLPPRPEGEGPEWYVGGSTAAWLLGAEIQPHDLDLGATRDGVDLLAARLQEFLIEPLATTDRPPGRIVRGARAFVGTFREGARVEWAAALTPSSGPEPTDVRCLRTTFRGANLPVERPEYALVRSAEKGALDRLGPIAAVVRRLGVDENLLARLWTASTASPAAREAVRRSLSDPSPR